MAAALALAVAGAEIVAGVKYQQYSATTARSACAGLIYLQFWTVSTTLLSPVLLGLLQLLLVTRYEVNPQAELRSNHG
jgi:hypothetical protein